MAYEPGTTPDASAKPSSDRVEAATGSRAREPRTFAEDLGYVFSVCSFLVGGFGLVLSTGSVPITVLLGEVGLALWTLLFVAVSSGLVAAGIAGMGRWDYYTDGAPR